MRNRACNGNRFGIRIATQNIVYVVLATVCFSVMLSAAQDENKSGQKIIAVSRLEQEPRREPLSRVPQIVEIPATKPIAVVLDTPIAARIATPGEVVKFHLPEAFPLASNLVLPPDTEIRGVVTLVKQAHSGKPPMLRVMIESLHLQTGGMTHIEAHLESAKPSPEQAPSNADSDRSRDLYGIMSEAPASPTATPKTNVGSAKTGAKKNGPEVFIESGTPFLVVLDQPSFLKGSEIYTAQLTYDQTTGTSDELSKDVKVPLDDRYGTMPQLKRRGTSTK